MRGRAPPPSLSPLARTENREQGQPAPETRDDAEVRIHRGQRGAGSPYHLAASTSAPRAVRGGVTRTTLWTFLRSRRLLSERRGPYRTAEAHLERLGPQVARKEEMTRSGFPPASNKMRDAKSNQEPQWFSDTYLWTHYFCFRRPYRLLERHPPPAAESEEALGGLAGQRCSRVFRTTMPARPVGPRPQTSDPCGNPSVRCAARQRRRNESKPLHAPGTAFVSLRRTREATRA
jgi:hypothetical protein